MAEAKNRIPLRLTDERLQELERLTEKMGVNNKNAALRRMIDTYAAKVERVRELEAKVHAYDSQLSRCRELLVHVRDERQRQERFETKVYQLVAAIDKED